MTRRFLTLILLFSTIIAGVAQEKPYSLFNGKDLKNWTQTGKAFVVAENTIQSQGRDEYLFLKENKLFENFELSCDVMTEKGSMADILFHTQSIKDKEKPKGYAIRIKNTYDGYGSGEKLKLTGSIDCIRNIYFPFVKDNEWFNLKIQVEGKQIRILVNDKILSEYYEPYNAWRPDDLKDRFWIKVHSVFTVSKAKWP
ncbi:MAG: DUF1080 domain-containing protein [Bacteroidales bacterium]|nr:DUF1080 domain-containing protein [Bacteroidales bacterium]